MGIFAHQNRLPRRYGHTNDFGFAVLCCHEVTICQSGKTDKRVIRCAKEGRSSQAEAHEDGSSILFPSSPPLSRSGAVKGSLSCCRSASAAALQQQKSRKAITAKPIPIIILIIDYSFPIQAPVIDLFHHARTLSLLFYAKQHIIYRAGGACPSRTEQSIMHAKSEAKSRQCANSPRICSCYSDATAGRGKPLPYGESSFFTAPYPAVCTGTVKTCP